MKLILFLLVLLGCAPANISDLRYEGEAEVRKLVSDLKKIETKDELQKAVPKIKKRFNKIAQVLVEIRPFLDSATEEPLPSSELLFIQLARLYEIPGGRELIENAQREAIRRM